MSLAQMMCQPLTVQTVAGTTTDAYGNSVPTPVGSPVAALGYLELKDSVEVVLNRDTVVSKWTAFFPATTTIGAFDYVNFNAQKFQVDGQPWAVFNPRTKTVSHIQCKLVVVT